MTLIGPVTIDDGGDGEEHGQKTIKVFRNGWCRVFRWANQNTTLLVEKAEAESVCYCARLERLASSIVSLALTLCY
jgi:hypothetical protein